MSDDRTQREECIKVLVAQVNLGIDKYGVHVLDEDHLQPIWGDPDGIMSHEEKRMHIENFARSYGLLVHLGSYARVAIFRKET